MAPVAAVVLGVVTLGLGLATVLLDSLTHQPGTGRPVADASITAASVVPAAVVGALLAACRPRNPIGWILLALILTNFIPTWPGCRARRTTARNECAASPARSPRRERWPPARSSKTASGASRAVKELLPSRETRAPWRYRKSTVSNRSNGFHRASSHDGADRDMPIRPSIDATLKVTRRNRHLPQRAGHRDRQRRRRVQQPPRNATSPDDLQHLVLARTVVNWPGPR
jgi:hypothetical protein